MPLSDTGRRSAGLAGWLAISFIAAALGAIASVQARSFYLDLIRPEWAPPGWVFGPVWTTLYALMGVAAWLVWQRAGWGSARLALSLFLVQLGFNAIWSWLFFAWHLGGLAFVDTLVLWILIVATMALFWRFSRLAALLMLPYLCWVSFASVLNWSVWQLNPTVL